MSLGAWGGIGRFAGDAFASNMLPGYTRETHVKQVMIGLLAALLLAGCAGPIQRKDGVNSQKSFTIERLAKTDTDVVTEIAQREALHSCRTLMEKLYRRNPAEFHKVGLETPEVAANRLFGELDHWEQSDLRQIDWEKEWRNAFRDDFAGDRVHAFMSALTVMLLASYDNKQTFYMTDQLDPQKLYNSARNIEVALWKLNSARQPNGAPYLFANSIEPGQVNLSFEREFGRLITIQDFLALVVEDGGNRSITRAVQGAARFVFLPI